MTTLVTAAEIAQVRRMVAELDTANYTDEQITTYIEMYPMLDELGEEPYFYDGVIPTKYPNEAWIPTYDLNNAAADIWQEKAALLAGKYDFTADGGSYSRSQAYNQAMSMSKFYRGRGSAKTIKQVKVPDENTWGKDWIANLPEDED